MSVTMNSIGMEMEEEEDDNISSPPSPWRRYEFADSPVKHERIRPSTQRVKALLMGVSHTRKVSEDDGMDGIIITEATSTTGQTIVTTGERSKGSSKSTPNNMPFDSIPLSKEGGERRISSLSGIGSSGARVFAGITSSTNVSLVSDISADSVKRSSKQTLSTSSPSRQKEASPNDSDTKRTETTLGTIMGTICEGIYDFCSTIIDDTTVGNNNNNMKSKEDRKKEAEETFLGKIIECPTFTCGGGGECSDESEYTTLSEIIL